ncbi:MAG: hypothetical protein HN875_02915, partial [Candidatus Nitrosopelagicus sp.]|nr:hypothetical protein [Candidatus Nitrosopelagicus sp.]
MKIILSLVVLFIAVSIPSAFAEVVITTASGSATPGCEVSSSCFFPSVATVYVGETIVFLNTDSAAHTFTAGTPESITGEFDTSVLMSGDSYFWTVNSGGMINYFCMIHPWMIGLIVADSPVVISSSTNISLNSIPSSIPLDYGPFMITGKLTTTDGTPLSGKSIWMQADSGDGRGQGGDAITDSNGYFERELYFWHEADIGNWEVYVYFESDADYDFSASTSRYITVEPPNVEPTVETTSSTNISLDWVTPNVKSGDSLFVSGTLTTSDGSSLSGKTILISINSEDGEGTGVYAITNSNGYFETNFDITSGMKTGEWSAQAFFNEDEYYFASISGYSYFTVESTAVIMDHTTLTFDYIYPIQSGDSVILTGSLNTLDGASISGKTILITIYPDNGGTGHGEYTTTDHNGNFVLNFYTTSNDDVGGWTADAEFVGDVNYFPSLIDSQPFIVEFYNVDSPNYPPRNYSADITIERGTSVPGCEQENNCYLPYQFSTVVGNTVEWYNADSAIHTVTSGTANDGLTGIFNSDMLESGKSFYHTFDKNGTFDYFCMIHPWMGGIVSVIDNSSNVYTGNVVASGENIPYSIIGGVVTSATIDRNTNSVIINIDAHYDGTLTISPSESTQSGIFMVLVDGEESNDAEINGNRVVVYFSRNVGDIEIIGTNVLGTFTTTPPKPIIESNAGTLTVDSAKYHVSRYNPVEVHFSGVVSEYNRGHSVLVDIQYPDGETLTQNIIVSSDESFNVSIFLNDDDPIGVYTINAKYMDREFSSLTFVLDKIPEAISSSTNISLNSIPSSIPLDYGPFMITGKLTTTDGTPLSGKSVWMDADSGDGSTKGGNAITDSNGYFERELYFWHEAEPGNWEVYVYFEGDANYDSSNSASRYITVTDEQKIYNIELQTDKAVYKLNDIIEVTPIASIYGGFITIGITDESGAIFAVVQYDLENHDPITFQLEDEWYVPGAEYIVFANYENSHAELTIYASENGPKPISKVSELTLDPLPISIKTGESITFSGKLVTSFGTPISKQTILIKDDDSFGPDDLIAKAVTDSTGYYKNTIIAKNWDATSGGASEIYAVFDGTDIYQGDRTSIYEVTVKSGIKNTSIIFDKLPKAVTEGESITFSGQLLTDDGTPLEGKTIYLKQDVLINSDNLFATLTTDSNGYFVVEKSFILPKYAEKLDVNFYVKWDGDDKNNSFRTSNQKITLTTSNPVKNTILTLDPLPNKITEGESITFSGQLLTDDGTPLEGKTIYVKDDRDIAIDKIIKTTTTDFNGKFKTTWSATVRSSGSYDFYAIFDGEEKSKEDKSLTYRVYVTAIQSFEPIRVFSDESVFEIGDSLVIYGDATPDEELQIALMDVNENIITSKTIQVSSSGSYSTTLYNWKQSTTFGDYWVVTWSAIDQRYDGFWVSFIEGVPKVSETKITLDRPPSSTVLNEPITFSGKLTTVDGSPIKNANVI